MPQQVDFKGLGIIEYPDDWTEDRIREDVRVNSAEITKKLQAALTEQAIQETSLDPENQPQGFLEHLGDAVIGTMQSMESMAGQPPKTMGRTLEIVPPEAFAQDPMGGMYIPPEQQRVFDEIHRQRAAESPDLVRERIASNPLVKFGEAIEADAKKRFETLPGAETRFWSGQVPQGLGTTAAGVGAALTTGPIGAFATMFSAEANDAWDEELQRQAEAGEPFNPDRALLKAYGYGAFASAVEYGLGVGRLTRQIKKVFGGTSKEAVERAAKAGVLGTFLVKTAKEAASGFTEEAIQRLGQSLIVHHRPDFESAIKEGLVGAVVQSGLSGPANLAESIRGPGQRLPATAEAVQGMQRDAGAAGVIEEPAPLTMEDVEGIEGVEEAVSKANAPKEGATAIPPLPKAKPGDAEGVPAPEGPAAIVEQIRLTLDPESSKAATLITNGTDVPEFDDTGLMSVKTKHGWVYFNPDKIGPDEIAEAAAGDVFDGTILGMADTGEKPVESAIAVTTSTPNARNVVTELVEPTDEAIKAATEAQQAAVPGGTTEVKPAAQIVAERREDRGEEPPEAPTKSDEDVAFEAMQAPDGNVSASFLQRRLKWGYQRAAKALSNLAKAGRVKPPEGATPGSVIQPSSEAAQPATPQAEQPGVVAPGTGGVVAPPVSAPKLTYEQFEEEYRKAYDRMLQYTPDEVGSSHFADRMAELADAYPEYLAKLEADLEAQSGVGTPGGVPERLPEQPIQGDQGGGTAERPAEPGLPAREPVRIKVGDKLESGQVGLTKTGRKTTPFPKVNVRTNVGATRTLKAVDRWLMENALAEAISRGDEFNQRQFHAAAKNPQQADKDSAEEYLFGDSPPTEIIKPALKPLVKKGGERVETQEEGQKEGVLKAPKAASAEATITPKEGITADREAIEKAKADAAAALADILDILGPKKLNIITPEQEAKLLPALTRLLDAAFRLGYYKFKEAARWAIEQIRSRAGDETADNITIDHLQGAYIGMSARYKDQGAENKKAVIAVETIGDLYDEAATDLPGELEGEQSGSGAGVGKGGPTEAEAGGRGDQPAGSPGDGGTRSDDAPEPMGDSGGVWGPPVPPADNYRITDQDAIGSGGLKSKFKANVAAIRVLKEIEAENRDATSEEQSILVKFTGWGAMGGAFGEVEGWAKEAKELQELLTEEEYATARRSTLDAFYTSPTVVRGIHGILERLGFRGGKMVEGGVGVGHFIGMMPEAWRGHTSYVGIERDSLTARIASKLYPKARIIESPFEKANLSRDTYDASAGNPPFGQQKLFDPNFKEESSFSIHNYFIAKQISLLRPGGVGVWVVSHRFLDKIDPQAREWISKHADFLGAMRLPSNAFKSNAGTEVTTDIVVFRKRDPGTQQGGVTDWQRTGTIRDEKTGKPIKLNAYFVDNPEMMLGVPSLEGKLYSGPREEGQFTLEPKPGVDLGEAIAKASEQFPKDLYSQEVKAETERLEHFDNTAVPKDVPVGAFFLSKDGTIMVRGKDENGLRTATPLATRYDNDPPIVRGLIEIRDTLRRLSALERDAAADPDAIEKHRKELNSLYDAFVKKFGILNRISNRRLFSDDPLSPRVFALERDIDPGVSKAKAKEDGVPAREPSASKADIFKKRVSFPVQEITSASDAKSGLAVSLNQRGMVDINYIASLTGLTPEQIAKDLEGVIFLTPQGSWHTAVDYLSGDVREKLKQAEEAAAQDSRFASNVEALKKVIPKDIPASQIRVPFGAPWVGEQIVSEFIQNLTGIQPKLVFYAKATGKWTVTVAPNNSAEKVTLSKRWGTPRMDFEAIINKTLSGQRISVYDEINDTKVLNEVETSLANQKAEEILDHWDNWLMKDADRRGRLVRAYNDLFNSYVQPEFDGSHMTLPGKTQAINLLKHQLRGAWRIITQRNVLLDHVVGAGKTFVGVSAFMEMRRLGICRKPIFAVPNHLTTQWRDEWIKLYPNANVLWAAPSDFAGPKRRKLFARIANGDWDAVIVGHSSLIHLGMPADAEADIIQEMINEIIEAIRLAREATGDAKKDARFIKDLERKKESLEAKLAKASARLAERERFMTFDELGIDGLFLDEAHEFKNLAYNTAMRPAPVGLGDPEGSDKSFDLLVKLHYLRTQFSGQAPVVFATGTPISNSLLEVFHVMRYLMPERIKKLGISTADAFMRTFGDIGAREGVDASGTRFSVSTAFKGFINGGELAAMYRSFADTVTTKNLHDQYQAEKGKRFPTPMVKGGKPKVMVVKRTDVQAAFFGEEDENGNYPPGTILHRIDNLPDDPSIDNMLAITTDARKAGLDMRIIDPSTPDDPGSNVNRCVSEVVRIYKENDYRRGTQLVFCDLSAPKSARKAVAAKKQEQAEGVFWIQVGRDGGKLEVVPPEKNPKPFTFDGAPEGFSFFSWKTNSGEYSATERSSGVQAFRAKTLKALKERASVVMAQPGMLDRFKEGVQDRKPSESALAEFLASQVEKSKPADQVEGTDAGDLAQESDDRIEFDEATAMASEFSVYDDVKKKLVDQGIPEAQIAFIHDFDKPAKKIDLFNRMNAGEVRVLLGSTPKLGAGTNVQKRLVALHHLDAPWRPSDLEQREGRIIRHGNEFYDPENPEAFKVEILRYATELTYDARMWDIIERKATGIEGFRLADANTREISEVAGEAASAAEMKAAASGNPLILEEIQLRMAIHKAELRARANRQQKWDLEAAIKDGEVYSVERAKDDRQAADAIEKLAKDHPSQPFSFRASGQTFTDKKQAQDVISAAVKTITPSIGYTLLLETVYRGLPMQFEYTYATTYDDGRTRPFLHLYVKAPGAAAQTKLGDSWDLVKETPSFQGILTRVDNYLEHQPGTLRERALETEESGKKKTSAARKALAELPSVETDISKMKERHAQVLGILRAEQENRKNRNKSKLDKAIDKTAADVKRMKESGERYSGAPRWLTPQLLNWMLRAIRALYLNGMSFRDAIRKVAADAKGQKADGYDEGEAVTWLEANVIEDKGKTRGASILLKTEPATESEPRGSQAQKAKPKPRNEPVQSLPLTDDGQPIQPGGRRGQSESDFGSPAYIRQKERERQLYAEEFIKRKGSLDAAMDHLGEIRDPVFHAVTAGEILAQAAESLRNPKAVGAMDAIDATRLVQRATAVVQAIKTDSGQLLQAQNQINERLGPFTGVLSYLELIRTHQERVLGKKFPSVVGDNIRAWMKESARRAVEAVARQLKDPNNVVSKMLRKAAVTADIPWSALFQSSWDTQKAAQVALFKAIRVQPDLAKLSKEEALEITNLLMKAWTKEHMAIFRSEFAKAVGQGAKVKPHDMAALVRSLPRMIRWLNLGLLDDEHFRQSVAPEYGIGTLDDAQVIRLSDLSQQAQATPEGSRRNRVYQEMVDIITASQGIKTTDLLKDFWFANVLSGLRTWIDVGVGSWLSGFTMVARAAADLSIRAKPRMAARVVANFVRATVEGIANAADIIATGDTSRLPDTQERLWKQLSGKGAADALESSKRFGRGLQRLAGQMAYVRRIMVGLDYVGALGARDAMLLYAALSRDDAEAIAGAMRRFDKAETSRAEKQAQAELGEGAKWVDVKARQREILEAGISEEIREGATNLGKVAALNADPVGFGGILYRAISLMPWIVRAPIGLSFARAAINMAQNASDWMPVVGLWNWGRAHFADSDTFREMDNRHPFKMFGLDVPVERRRLILGAQIGGLALTAAAMGLFLDDDDEERLVDINGTWRGVTPQQKGQLLTQGEKPLSIRIGDIWYSYKNTPLAAALAFVGNLRDMQRFQRESFNGESAAEKLVNAWYLGALYIKDVSALSQFSEIIGQAAISTKDDLEGANRKFASTLGNTLSGFIPGASMLREIDTITDPSVYRPNGGIEAWIRNIPFARRGIGVGPAVDALGDEIQAPRTPWGRWVSGKSDDSEWETLAKLALHGTFVPVPSKTATIIGKNGGRRRMTPEEYYEYQKAAGKLWRAEIRNGRDVLRSAKPEAAAKWFKDRTEDLHAAARAKVRAME